MADLSQLSDEQLQVYRDLLAAKQDPRLGGAPPPGVPKPPLPPGLAGPKQGEESSVGGSGNEPGLPAIVSQGISQFGRAIPAFANSWKRGVSNVLEGGAKMASPLAIPALATAPAATLAATAIAMGAQKGGEKLANVLGASPDTERLAGDVSGLVAGPLASRVFGAVAKAVGKPLAESALGIRGQTHAYGADPGKAILEETHGVSPGTIAESARAKLGDLSQQLTAKAAASPNVASLDPARNVISGAMAKARAANSGSQPAELAPMQLQLTEPQKGFAGATQYPAGAATPISFQQGQPSPVLGANGQPMPGPMSIVPGKAPSLAVSALQKPTDFLNMKRQFDTDFIRNWNPATNTKGQLGVARQAYGSMADEFNRAVPGAKDLNTRISSLIPVAERARLTDLNAGPVQRIADRVARPTGAMLPALMGLHEGGLPGMMLSITGQEMGASPVVKLLGARSLHGFGSGLTSLPGMAGATIPPLTLRRDQP